MRVRRSKGALFRTIGAAIAITLAMVVVVINFHTPEKRIEHQIKHLYSERDAQFEQEMGTLLGPAILSGNEITALQNGDEIFPAMLTAIREAKTTIDFETYIYWAGKTGAQFAQALVDPSRAGV